MVFVLVIVFCILNGHNVYIFNVCIQNKSYVFLMKLIKDLYFTWKEYNMNDVDENNI